MYAGFSTTISSWIPRWTQDQNTIADKLQAAIDSNSISEVEAFLKDSTLANQLLPNGERPLNYAIRQGRHEIVKWIASKHTTILDGIDAHGLTPVDHALLSEDSRMIGIIVGHKLGFKYDEAAKHFSRKLNYFGFKKEIAFARSVTECCKPETTLLYGAFEAAATGNLPLILELLETNLDVNATTVEGWSLLHLAAKSGNADLVKLLLSKGARTDFITVTHGISPLHVAATGKSRKVIQYLLDAGASLTATDKQGSTALHYAMTNNELFSAQLLIEKGMDCSQVNRLGMSPLSIMAAMACIRANNQDELKLDYMQAMMFAGITASCIAGYCGGDIPNALATLAWAATIVPTVMVFKNTKSLVSRAILIGTLGLSFIPGINIAAQAWRTYVVGQSAIKGITKAWKYRHIEMARPIRNAVIFGTNSLYSGKKLIDSINWATLMLSKGIEIAERVPEYAKDAPTLFKIKMDECAKNSIDQETCTQDLVWEEFARFEEEGYFSLWGGDKGPEFCKDLSLKACIDENNLHPGLSKHAQSILGISANISANECKKSYRAMSSKHHPDKGGDASVFIAIGAAKDRLCSKETTTDKRVSFLKPIPNLK